MFHQIFRILLKKPYGWWGGCIPTHPQWCIRACNEVITHRLATAIVGVKNVNADPGQVVHMQCAQANSAFQPSEVGK